MKLFVATTNSGKMAEIRAILDDLTWLTLESLADHPEIVEVEETGASFLANARLKASHYSLHARRLTVSEDSGLEVDALDGAPGVRSARFNGSTYEEKFVTLRAQLAASGVTDSTARFVCAIAVADGGSIVFETTATVEGRLAPEPRGLSGFGYDPIFFYPPYGCTLGQVTGTKKSAVSHRGKAVRQLKRFLQQQRSEP